jgi:hypothetical protein
MALKYVPLHKPTDNLDRDEPKSNALPALAVQPSSKSKAQIAHAARSRMKSRWLPYATCLGFG